MQYWLPPLILPTIYGLMTRCIITIIILYTCHLLQTLSKDQVGKSGIDDGSELVIHTVGAGKTDKDHV